MAAQNDQNSQFLYLSQTFFPFHWWGHYCKCFPPHPHSLFIPVCFETAEAKELPRVGKEAPPSPFGWVITPWLLLLLCCCTNAVTTGSLHPRPTIAMGTPVCTVTTGFGKQQCLPHTKVLGWPGWMHRSNGKMEPSFCHIRDIDQ